MKSEPVWQGDAAQRKELRVKSAVNCTLEKLKLALARAASAPYIARSF
jgi:hypothetical protein